MHNSELTKTTLVNQNIYYAKKLARRFYNKRAHTHAELDDLEAAAYLGLCEAASRFDSSKDNKFQTYSYMRIVGAMYDYLVTSGGASRSTYKKLEGYSNSKTGHSFRIARDLHELSRAKALIEEWGIRIEVNLKQGTIDLIYLNEVSIDEQMEKAELLQKVKIAMFQLPSSVSKILVARYLEGKRLNEIAKEYPEYSKSHVGRLCSNGIKDLRRKLKITLQ